MLWIEEIKLVLVLTGASDLIPAGIVLWTHAPRQGDSSADPMPRAQGEAAVWCGIEVRH